MPSKIPYGSNNFLKNSEGVVCPVVVFLLVRLLRLGAAGAEYGSSLVEAWPLRCWGVLAFRRFFGASCSGTLNLDLHAGHLTTAPRLLSGIFSPLSHSGHL